MENHSISAYIDRADQPRPLDRACLDGPVLGEAATLARQAGVPAHAIVGVDELDRFDARILWARVTGPPPGMTSPGLPGGDQASRMIRMRPTGPGGARPSAS